MKQQELCTLESLDPYNVTVFQILSIKKYFTILERYTRLAASQGYYDKIGFRGVFRTANFTIAAKGGERYEKRTFGGELFSLVFSSVKQDPILYLS